MILLGMINQAISDRFLCCPKDKSHFDYSDNKLTCPTCDQTYEIHNGIVTIIPDLTPDIKLSIDKWDEFYRKELHSNKFHDEYDRYMNMHFKDVYRQVNEVKTIKNSVYMEIGCGPGFFMQKIAGECEFVIGIDFCPSALKIVKKMLDEKNITNYLLIQADILRMPIQNNRIDLIYGGGVIEHFEDTQKCIDELYRVLRTDGVSFNTVPYLNIGSLTYRQVWGNIPNMPVLKQLAELIHIKILKGKHMIFGYEMSFLASTLEKVHKRAGFRDIHVRQFDVKMVFEFLPAFARKPFMWLAAHSRLFWPMVKVYGKK